MDYVTWFALGTLTAVFLLAAGVLIVLCWRRKKQRQTLALAESKFIYAKNRDDKVGNLIELSPLLDTELKNCEWVEAGTGGPLDEVVDILRLTTEVVKILSTVNITRAAPKIYEVIVQAMFRVDTHFHELLEFTPTEQRDIRVIEARSLTLTTCVWSLNAAFTLHGHEHVKDVEDRVIRMYEHVDKLRQLIPGYEGRPRVKEGGEGKDDDEEEEEEADSQVTDETMVEAASPSSEAAPLASIIRHEALPAASTSIAVQQQKVDVHVDPEPDDDAAAAAASTASRTPPPRRPSDPPKATPTSNGAPVSTVSKDTVEGDRDPLLSPDGL